MDLPHNLIKANFTTWIHEKDPQMRHELMKFLVDEMEEVWRPAEDGYPSEIDEYIKAVVEAGVDIEAHYQNKTLLTHCGRIGSLASAKLLINQGALLDPRPTKEGIRHTPLMTACLHGHEELVQFLLGKGASVDLLDEEGESAAFWAARGGSVSCLRLLHEQGADLNRSNFEGETPLHAAFAFREEMSEENAVKVICYLLDHGADLERPFADGSRILNDIEAEFQPDNARAILTAMRRKKAQDQAAHLEETTQGVKSKKPGVRL